MTFISLRPQPAAVLPETPCNDFTLNRVLHPMDDPEWPKVTLATGLDKAECWNRKFEGAKFQYPHIAKSVFLPEHSRAGVKGKTVLMPGGYEDPLAEVMWRHGALLTLVDPALGQPSFHDWVVTYQDQMNGYFDLVLCASVLEHVKDDREFITDIVDCLKPGGHAFLTTDFKEGWKAGDPLAPTQERMYTKASLMALTDTIDSEVKWCGERDWQSRGDYFPYAGLWFSFASIAFKKRGGE